MPKFTDNACQQCTNPNLKGTHTCDKKPRVINWQPINTAPKDGRSVLLRVCGVVVQAHWGVGREGDYNNPEWIPDHTGGIWHQSVTHWMDLPKEP